MAQGADATKGFQLGEPALVCRWRIVGGRLPLANRHYRALASRVVNGAPVTPELVAWVKQHVEQTLARGSAQHPDGVLMLVIDVAGRAAMTVGPFESLEEPDARTLLGRAAQAYREGEATGVAPESLWIAHAGELVWGTETEFVSSGVASLIEDLAHTMGVRVERRPQLHRSFEQGLIAADEAFLASDEHGIVLPRELAGPRGTRLAQSYRFLLDKESKKAR